MRATQTTTFRSLQSFLDRTSDRMSTLRMQAATGKRLTRASDDPTAISPILSANTEILSAERYLLTMGTGLDKVQNADSHLENVENIMQRVKEVAIAGVNGSLSDLDMLTFADEIAGLKDQLFETANSQVNGQYIFSGYEIKTKPFVENTLPDYDPALPPDPDTNAPVSYKGDDGLLNLEIGPNEQVAVAVDGAHLFLGWEDTDGNGIYDSADTRVGVDVFQQLATLEYNLRNLDAAAVSAQIEDLDVATDQIRKYRSSLGNVGRRMESSMDRMESIKLDQQAILSRYQDVDIIAAITSLQQQESSFEAALNVTSKVSELTILKYL